MSNPKQIALSHALTEGIRQGHYAVGTVLPTEFELCEQFQVSRYAVRQVLNELQGLGLISRRKNVGSTVQARLPSASFSQSIATMAELTQFGAMHTRQVQSIEELVADLELAKQLGCPGGSRWTRISSLRIAQDKQALPIGWTDVYIDAGLRGIAQHVQADPSLLISSLIENHYGKHIASVKQRIEAAIIPASIAQALQVEADAPALKITRHYADSHARLLEISVSLHPADRFQLETTLSRTASPAAG